MFSDISLRSVRINDPLWTHIQKLIREVVLPYQWEALCDRVPDAEPSFCVSNFKIAAGSAQGSRQGMVFQDSDLYKWLEAVSYSLMIAPDARLLEKAEEAVGLIARAQAPDGYLNTYYMLCEPDQRFQNLTEGHELYCAGHLFEAAVAFYEATEQRGLLDVAVRFADCIARYFLSGNGGPEGGAPGAGGSDARKSGDGCPASGKSVKGCSDDGETGGGVLDGGKSGAIENRGYPGHPEIEPALIRLYHATQNETYIKLCQYFLEKRGTGVCWRDIERERGTFKRHWGDALFEKAAPSYMQAHAPVREQRQAAGHAVRAMYLYSAMADMALLGNDGALRQACLALYENVVTRQMYVTGGIGAAADGERFTTDYDLPNDSVYAETCASVGLMMFSARMWRLTKRAACYDTFEKALYNTVLACMGKDGRHFFYVNPLSVDPRLARENPTLSHVATTRAKWFGCSCCPPNMARAVLSLGCSIFSVEEDAFYLLSHIESSLSLDGMNAELAREGDQYRLSIDAPARAVKLRLPSGFVMEADQGEMDSEYLTITHAGGAAVYTYRLTPQIRVLYAHPRIASDAGKVCVAYGQMIYCLEEADNGKALCALALPRGASFSTIPMDWLPEGMVALQARGVRRKEEGWREPYRTEPPETEPVTLTFIPYSQWNNRGEGEMRVWINES